MCRKWGKWPQNVLSMCHLSLYIYIYIYKFICVWFVKIVCVCVCEHTCVCFIKKFWLFFVFNVLQIDFTVNSNFRMQEYHLILASAFPFLLILAMNFVYFQSILWCSQPPPKSFCLCTHLVNISEWRF